MEHKKTLEDLLREKFQSLTRDELIEEKLKYKNGIKSGGGWIIFIGIASIVNTIALFFYNDFGFLIGLGITQLIDVLFLDFPEVFRLFGMLLSILISLGLVIMGWFARKSKSWAYKTTLVFYFLDALLFLFFKDYFGFGFHILAIFFI